MKVDVMFTEGHNIVGNSVEKITNSEWAHASIFILEGIVEAIHPKVTNTKDLNKYNDYKREIITVEVPYYESACIKTNELLGTKYGALTDCIDGGLATLLKSPVSKGNGEATVNCSELVTRILRAGGITILPDYPADCITPEMLYRALLEISRIQEIEGVQYLC